MFVSKRIYEPTEDNDGKRILVDRLWPRGISKEKAKLDEWLKNIAPSTELRSWFGHDPGKFEEFKMKYKLELKKLEEDHQGDIERLLQMAKKEKITLLYAAKDELHNQAIVLLEFLNDRS